MSTVESPTIKPGDTVRVRSSDGSWSTRTATTGVELGRDFPVVWVSVDGRSPVPWPADEVEPA